MNIAARCGVGVGLGFAARFALLLICGCVMFAASYGEAGASDASPKAHPATYASVLDSGRIRKVRWVTFAEHSPGADGAGWQGSRRPCIGVGLAEPSGVLIRERHSVLCYGRPGYLDATAEPLIVTLDANQTRAVTAIAIASAVREVQIRFSDGTTRSLQTAAITSKQSRFLRLRRFNYSAMVSPANDCIDEVITLNDAKALLWESGPLDCDSEDG